MAARGAGRGFFSMQHKVVEVGAALQRLYVELDAHAAEELVTSLARPAPDTCLCCCCACLALSWSARGTTERIPRCAHLCSSEGMRPWAHAPRASPTFLPLLGLQASEHRQGKAGGGRAAGRPGGLAARCNGANGAGRGWRGWQVPRGRDGIPLADSLGLPGQGRGARPAAAERGVARRPPHHLLQLRAAASPQSRGAGAVPPARSLGPPYQPRRRCLG